MSKLKLLAAAFVALALVTSCGGGETTAPDAADVPEPVEEPTEEPAEQDAASGSIDTCAFFSEADAKKFLGGGVTQEAKPPQGSLLGQCDYATAEGLISVQARPDTEWDATKSTFEENSEEISGLGEDNFFNSSFGLLVLTGEGYFIHVLSTQGGQGFDKDSSVEIAEIVLGNI
ncbi:MAG TPA: hypothetical protein VNP73_07965 [Actinomycetota bacterium]|nr:hypothetical protein [Actinomycetota bacterium]